MQQVSWRADGDLVLRVKHAAAHRGCSMNEFMTLVLDVATDPYRVADAHASLRERLRLAGLLADTVGSRPQPIDASLVRKAGRRMGEGGSMSEAIIEERR